MPDSLRNPWPNNPNAPQILLSVNHKEETAFVGTFIAMMLYGTLNHSLVKRLTRPIIPSY